MESTKVERFMLDLRHKDDTKQSFISLLSSIKNIETQKN